MRGSLETRLRGFTFERTSAPYRTVSVIVSEPELMRGSLETRLRGRQRRIELCR